MNGILTCVLFLKTVNCKQDNTDKQTSVSENVSALSDDNPDINQQQAAGCDQEHGGDEAKPDINDHKCRYCFCIP